MEHRATLLSYIYTAVRDFDAAAEVFQEVSVAVCESHESFEPGTNFCAWAREIARRRILAEWRSAGRFPGLLSDGALRQIEAGFRDAETRWATGGRIAARVNTNQLPANKGDDWTQYFKTGAGVDLQLKTDMCQRVLFVPKGQGKAEAVLSRKAKYDGAAAWGEVREDVVYETPFGKLTMGQVIRIRADSFDAAFGKTDEGYTMEGAVTLSLLRLRDGSTVLGDVGILFNNPAGTATARRVYWANADTAVVADTPTEARFQPEKWGPLKLPTISAEPTPDPSSATPAKFR